MKAEILNHLSIVCISVILMIAPVFIVTCSKGDKTSPDSLNILIITGGHKFERTPFFEMFDGFENLTYKELTHPGASDIYGSAEVDKYDALVFYDMVQEISIEQKADFVRLLENGKGLVFLHHALASYQDWPEFEKIMGGHYLLEPVRRGDRMVPASNFEHDVDIPVSIVDKEHPITMGLQSFTIHDETYGDFIVHPDVQPLLATDHPKSGPVIGWTNRYGKSRIATIQLGHDHYAYEDINYRRILERAIQWVAGKL